VSKRHKGQRKLVQQDGLRTVRPGDVIGDSAVSRTDSGALLWCASSKGPVFDVTGQVVQQTQQGLLWAWPLTWEEVVYNREFPQQGAIPPGGDTWAVGGRKRKPKINAAASPPAPQNPTTETPPAPKRDQPPAKVEVGNRTLHIDGKGKLWHHIKLGEATARVELTGADKERALRKIKVLDAALIQGPDPGLRVPQDTLAQWGTALLDAPGEAMAAYGYQDQKDPKTGKVVQRRWLAVVPEQECTGASIDVKDWEPAISTLVTKGFQRMGTIHTHPGDMTQCSSTDTDEQWDKFPGVHYIVTRAGSVAVYFSLGGHTWGLRSKEWEYPKIQSAEPPKSQRGRRPKRPRRPKRAQFQAPDMIAQDGSANIKGMIKEPVRVVGFHTKREHPRGHWLDEFPEMGEHRMGPVVVPQAAQTITGTGEYGLPTGPMPVAAVPTIYLTDATGSLIATGEPVHLRRCRSALKHGGWAIKGPVLGDIKETPYTLHIEEPRKPNGTWDIHADATGGDLVGGAATLRYLYELAQARSPQPKTIGLHYDALVREAVDLDCKIQGFMAHIAHIAAIELGCRVGGIMSEEEGKATRRDMLARCTGPYVGWAEKYGRVSELTPRKPSLWQTLGMATAWYLRAIGSATWALRLGDGPDMTREGVEA